MATLYYLVNQDPTIHQTTTPLRELRPLLGSTERTIERLAIMSNDLREHFPHTIQVLNAVARQENASGRAQAGIHCGAATLQIIARHEVVERSHKHLAKSYP